MWRVVIGILIVANLMVFGAYFGLQYFTDRLASEVGTNEEVVAELNTQPAAGAPLNFLVIGSDSREALPDDFGEFGNFGGQRADVIMVVRVMDDGVRILSIPRDLKAQVEGHGTQKINAAYAFGGAPLMVKTVRDATGLEIHHYAEIDFFGFASLVDELGGVRLNFPYPARDLKSELDVEAGEQEVDGKTALAYARSRQYEELRNGSWQSVNGSDLGRIERQQTLIFAMLASAKRPSIVFDALGIIDSLGDHMSADATLDGDTITDLALSARSLDRSSIDATTLPTRFSNEGGVSYLVPEEPAASDVLALFTGDAPVGSADFAAGPLRLRVLNGNGGAGQATEWAATLESMGYEVVSIADADTFDFATTVVQTSNDRTGDAEGLIDELGFGVVEVGSVPAGVDAVIIMGGDARDG